MERRQQVEELFHAALDREPAERETFLSQACRTDPELRAEVESLISAHEEPGSFLDSPVYDPIAETSSLVGQSIGRYLVLSLLGRGGMGEVYLARDTQLDRKLALKLLPEQYTADEIRVRRFILEARAASSLNHPNIITIHEIGYFGPVHFIATEFVEGETLRHRISRGPIPIADALAIAIQVASALAAAHAAGIVHRDIKPENIMVRPDRYVKVLDFGLAKLAERPVVLPLSSAPTAARVDTDPGTVMGTTRYMSPEQARGLDVDARSDIFNMGIVLYEMIAGRVPFAGDTPADVVASILKTDPPPLADSAPDLPADLEEIVRKALSKDKANRFETSEQMLAELEAVKGRLEFEAQLDRSESTRTEAAPAKVWLTLSVRQAILYVFAILLVAFVAWRIIRTPERDSFASFDNPKRLTAWKSSPGPDSIDYRSSPDGKMIAYSSTENDNKEAIIVKQINGDNEIQVTPNEWQGVSLLWSPDSQQLAFAAKRERQVGIYLCPFLGGSKTLIKMFNQVDNSRSIWLKHWSKDGSTIFYESEANLFALDIESKQTSRLTDFPPSLVVGDMKDFSISPNEDLIAYRDQSEGQVDLWMKPIEGGNPARLTNDPEDDFGPRWHPDGNRIFYNTSRHGHTQINVAYRDGRRPVQVTRGEGDYRLMDVTADGTNDRTKIFYSSAKDESDIIRVRLDSREEVEVASGLEAEFWTDVSPDGSTVAFQTNPAPSVTKALYNSRIVVKSSTSAPETLAINGYDPRWLPDGQRVLFLRSEGSGRLPNLWTVNTIGKDEKRITDNGVLLDRLSNMPFNRAQTRDFSCSPDGKQVAYCSLISGLWNVWTTSIDGSGDRNISNNDDSQLRFFCPMWSPDGNRIAYTWRSDTASANGGRVWYVSVVEDNKPRTIFERASPLRLLGWSHTGEEVLISSDNKSTPASIDIFRPSVAGNSNENKVTVLESAYAMSVQLSADGKLLAFTSRKDGRDNIWVRPTNGGEEKKLTDNSDPKRYLGSLAWSPDGRSIYYDRQSRWNTISTLSNHN